MGELRSIERRICIYIYIYIYADDINHDIVLKVNQYMYISVYLSIYICVYIYVYLYIYIYIYIYFDPRVDWTTDEQAGGQRGEVGAVGRKGGSKKDRWRDG